MKPTRLLIVVLLILAAAVPAQAKKDKPKSLTKLEALLEAPLYPDPVEQERGQALLNEACAAMLGRDAVCDLAIKDAEIDGFWFNAESGVLSTSIDMMDAMKDDELRAAFAWAIAWSEAEARPRAAEMQKKRTRALVGISKVNPSVGAGSVQFSGRTAVGVGVGLSPATVMAILDAVSLAVEDTRLASDYQEIDKKVARKLAKADAAPGGLVRLLEHKRKEGDGFLAERETGIGHVDTQRLKKAKEAVE